MAIATDEIRSTIKDLKQICKDGEEGFRDAAEKITNPEVKVLFNEFSGQRARFSSELQTLIAKLGGEPDNTGTLSGAVHRGWLNLKSMVTGHDDAAIISEAERGEDVAVKGYREALSKDLPMDIHSILEEQYQKVQATHNQVRALEIKTKHA